MLVRLTWSLEGSERVKVCGVCICKQVFILSGDLSGIFSDPLKSRVAQRLEGKIIVSVGRFMKIDEDGMKNVPKSHFTALGDHQ